MEEGWTTNREKEYIKDLINGDYLKWSSHHRTISLDDLLRNYIRSAKKRMADGTFCGVNGVEVIEYARSFLSEED